MPLKCTHFASFPETSSRRRSFIAALRKTCLSSRFRGTSRLNLAGGALNRDRDRAVIVTSHGVSAIVDVPIAGIPARRPVGRNLAVNASLMHPRTAVPALQSGVLGTETTIAAIVVADRSGEIGLVSAVEPVVPPAVFAVLDRIADEELR